MLTFKTLKLKSLYIWYLCFKITLQERVDIIIIPIWKWQNRTRGYVAYGDEIRINLNVLQGWTPQFIPPFGAIVLPAAIRWWIYWMAVDVDHVTFQCSHQTTKILDLLKSIQTGFSFLHKDLNSPKIQKIKDIYEVKTCRRQTFLGTIHNKIRISCALE